MLLLFLDDAALRFHFADFCCRFFAFRFCDASAFAVDSTPSRRQPPMPPDFPPPRFRRLRRPFQTPQAALRRFHYAAFARQAFAAMLAATRLRQAAMPHFEPAATPPPPYGACFDTLPRARSAATPLPHAAPQRVSALRHHCRRQPDAAAAADAIVLLQQVFISDFFFFIFISIFRYDIFRELHLRLSSFAAECRARFQYALRFSIFIAFSC